MEIRKARPEDIKEWFRLCYSVKSEDLSVLYKMVTPITEESTGSYLKELIESDGSFLLICFDGTRAVGSIDLVRKTRPENCHVASGGMSVLKEYRGRGIGRKLLERTIDICREEGKIRKLELEVFENNPVAVKFYESLKFEHECRRKRSIVKDGMEMDLLMMGRYLD